VDAVSRLEALREAYPDQAELELVVGKLLDVALRRYRQRLEHYEDELRQFEQRYGLDSDVFYQRFEAGELGDATDYFEWASLYELRQDLLLKVERLEATL